MLQLVLQFQLAKPIKSEVLFKTVTDASNAQQVNSQTLPELNAKDKTKGLLAWQVKDYLLMEELANPYHLNVPQVNNYQLIEELVNSDHLNVPQVNNFKLMELVKQISAQNCRNS